MSNKFLNGITTYGDIELKNGRINFPNSSISEDKNGIYINTTIDGANEIETGISLVSNGVAEYINAESHNVFSKTVGLPKCIINDIVYFDGKYVAATFSWTNQAYGIYYSYDGQHWQPSTLSTGRIQRLCVCDTEHGQILLAAYFAKGFKVSKDGINWTTTNTADTSFDVSGKWGSVAFGNGLIVAGDDNGVYDGTTGTTTINKENALVYSTLTSAADGTFNAGAWTRVNIDGKGIHEVAFINNTWFVGTTAGLYITSSPAATFSTWRKVLESSAVFSIIFSEEANAYFIGTGDCVFKSTDLQSFTEVCGASDIIASGLVARTLACHDKFVIVGTEDGLQGLISDNYGEAGSWKRFAGFDENPTKANYKRIKFINGTFFLGNGSDADMDRCPESPIMFFDIDKVIATTADVERANKLTFAAIEQIEEAKSGLEDSIAAAVSTKADKSDVYTKSEIDSKNIEFLKKESSGIQTVSSDLALTGYVLIDNLAIDELNIESLSATSNVALSGGLTVTNGLVADSIKIGSDAVALAKNIPGIATSSVAGIAKYDGKGVAIESDGTVNLKLRTNHSGVEFENGGLYVQTSTTAHPTAGTVAPVATDTAGKLVVPDATSSAKGGVKLATSLDDTGVVSVTTASQVKTALAGKANSTHSHTTSAVDGLSEAIAAATENKADKATTLAGYGITDAYTKSEIDSKNVEFLKKESSGIQTVSSDLALTGYVLIDNLSIDELEIESLTASSKVTLSGGLDVAGGLVADSIKVGNDAVALAKNIPNVSSFITKDVSNLTNYETKTTAEGKYALKTDIYNVYKYIGSVDAYSALPTTGQKAGDVYNIVNADAANNISAGDNVAWTGSSWDKLGGSIDLSNYALQSSVDALKPENSKLIIDSSTTISGEGGNVFVYINATGEWSLDLSKMNAFTITDHNGNPITTSGTGKAFFAIKFAENNDGIKAGKLILNADGNKYEVTFTQLEKIVIPDVPELPDNLVTDDVFSNNNTWTGKNSFNSLTVTDTCVGTIDIAGNTNDYSFELNVKHDGLTNTLTIPYKTGTLAIASEHYTKTESDNKYLYLNDTGVVQLNGVYDSIAFNNPNGGKALIDLNLNAFISESGTTNTAYKFDSIVHNGQIINLPLTAGRLALVSDIPDISNKADKATTLAGYGITDAYTKTEVNDLVAVKADASTVYTKSEIDSKNVSFLTKDSSGIQTVSSDLALTGYVLIDNLAIDELEIASLTASSKVTLGGGLDVTGGITVDGKEVATKSDIPDTSIYVKTNSAAELNSVKIPKTGTVEFKTVFSGTGIPMGGAWDFATKIDSLNGEFNQLTIGRLTYNGNAANFADALKTELYDALNITNGSVDDLTGISLINAIYANATDVGANEQVKFGNLDENAEANSYNVFRNTNRVNVVAYTSDLVDYALKTEIPNVSAFITKDVSNLTNYETKTTAEGKYAQKATTLAGYGITNVYTKTEADGKFITKDVNNLTNYETKTVAEGKYALKEEIPEVPTSAKYEIPAKTPSSNKIVWTITLDEEPDVAPIMQVFNNNGDVVYANITYAAGVITVVINSASACAEGDYYIIVSGQTGNSGYRTKVISNADFAQAALDNKIDLNTIYYIV